MAVLASINAVFACLNAGFVGMHVALGEPALVSFLVMCLNIIGFEVCSRAAAER